MDEVSLDGRGANESGLSMRPLSAHTGMEITGVDLSQPLSEPVYHDLRRALEEWGVIFFRDQDITPAQQVAFAKRFGPVEPRNHPSSLGAMKDVPELSEIRRKPTDRRNIGGFWHTDQCFIEKPPLGSVLYARDLPKTGGDTMFAHMGAVCDQLSDGLKATLKTLRATHVRLNSYGIGGQLGAGITAEEFRDYEKLYTGVEATHPVIGRHPGSGRETLYLNHIYSDRFAGWTRAESQPLIQYLCDLSTRPENVCRFHWEPGSLAFWDNRSVVHYALDDYPDEVRIMHRCVVRGPWLEPV